MLLHSAETYDNLIGFVTKLDEFKDHKEIDKVEELSRFGTLLKIQKSDVVNGYQVFERTKVYNVNYLGLTFARYLLSNPGSKY